jgi:two-component system NtrC family sensor kinase
MRARGTVSMFRLGLRTKFFLYSNTLIAVTMILVTVIAVVHERRIRYSDIVGRGRSITEALAVPVTDTLMYQDLDLVSEGGLIENYIDGVIAQNRALIRYVVITDRNGVVINSNRLNLLGQHFARALGREAIGRPSVVEQRTSSWGEPILEVRVPLNISSKFWGSLAMGFSLSSIEQQVRTITKRAVALALLLMLGNSIITAIYVETLIRPILGLHNTMQKAAAGDLAARAHVRRGDEVGDLADTFNWMMEELERAGEGEKLRAAQLAHTEKMAAVGTLAAGVAHEVNNPLAGILTCLETIRAHPEDGATRERYLALVEDGIKRIEHTVSNLLDFSRRSSIRLEPTSLNHSLRHVSELVQYQLRKRRVEVAFELSPVEPVVLADHFQMEQLFLNLVLNAIQAMPDGGKVTLRTRMNDGTVTAEVSDTGVGIPEDIRDRIFDPFFSTREFSQGTGLGLAVSYNIVSSHGGTIEFESQVGKGTTFRVILPRDRARTDEGARQ